MNTQVEHFSKELDKLVDRFRREYDISYAEVVGCLYMKTHELFDEAKEESEGETP